MLDLIQTAHAAPAFSPTGTLQTGQDSVAILSSFLAQIIFVLTYVAGVAAVLYLIFAGLRLINSKGNPEKLKDARSGVISAIIGIVIIVASYAAISLAIRIGGFVNDGQVRETTK